MSCSFANGFCCKMDRALPHVRPEALNVIRQQTNESENKMDTSAII